MAKVNRQNEVQHVPFHSHMKFLIENDGIEYDFTKKVDFFDLNLEFRWSTIYMCSIHQEKNVGANYR